jgi:uncharacterized protein (DUF1330 family)
MAAYFIARITVKNPALYEQYRREASGITARHGGKYLVRGGAIEIKEGAWLAERTVIIEFSDLAAAHAWYDSPEYQAILPLRQAAAESEAIFAEGACP